MTTLEEFLKKVSVDPAYEDYRNWIDYIQEAAEYMEAWRRIYQPNVSYEWKYDSSTNDCDRWIVYQ